MQDPPPENIDGQVVQKHVFEHRFDWGYLALGVGLMAVAYVLWVALQEDSDDDEDSNF